MKSIKLHYIDVVTDQPLTAILERVGSIVGDTDTLRVEILPDEDHPHGAMCWTFTGTQIIHCERGE